VATRNQDLLELGFDVASGARQPDYDEARARYKQLAFELHPDRGGDPERFAAVTAAWERLEKRYGYTITSKQDGRRCNACRGTGKVYIPQPRSFALHELRCSLCNGSGKVLSRASDVAADRTEKFLKALDDACALLEAAASRELTELERGGCQAMAAALREERKS
jgi:DnaJ-class molecular chaperone